MSILKTKPTEAVTQAANNGWVTKTGELLVSVKNLIPKMVAELETVKKMIEDHPDHKKGS
jgi:hypothetical protein